MKEVTEKDLIKAEVRDVVREEFTNILGHLLEWNQSPWMPRITVYMLEEDIESFFNGNYQVTWCTNKLDMNAPFEKIVELNISSTDYYKLSTF